MRIAKMTVCQEREHATEYYKSNPTCKKCAIILTGNRRKVGIVSMHEKVDKMLEKQDNMLKF